jgi:hypothetical protein
MVAQHRWPLTIWIPIPEWAVGVIVLAIAVGIGAWTVHGVVDTLAQKRALVGMGTFLILFSFWFTNTAWNAAL